MEEQVQKEQSVFSVEETVKEPIVITGEKPRVRRKTGGDDVVLMQCLLCLVLVVSIFSLQWINPSFQEALLSQYEQKLHAPAEAFLQQFLEWLESWVR